jgi:5'-3' exonuclease
MFLPSKPYIILDAYNLIHRSRFEWGGGLANGENQIIYNFFRSLKSIIDQFEPSKVFFVLDGKPIARIESLPSYKENRKIDTSDPEIAAYWESFHSQKRQIIASIKQDYPITTVYHPHYECDDLIYHIVEKMIPSDQPTVIVSSDSDFIQIINTFENVKLFNPVKSEYRQKTAYDYVAWKAMVGDKADNIPGVKGIGKTNADKILADPALMQKKMQDETFVSQYNHSYSLIKLSSLNDESSSGIIYTEPKAFNSASVMEAFEKWDFKSMIKDSYFSSYAEVYNSIGE